MPFARPSKEGSERAYAVVMSGTEAVEQAHVAEAELPAPDLSVVVTLYNEAGPSTSSTAERSPRSIPARAPSS